MEKVQENVVGELRWGEKMERDTLAMAGEKWKEMVETFRKVFWCAML